MATEKENIINLTYSIDDSNIEKKNKLENPVENTQLQNEEIEASQAEKWADLEAQLFFQAERLDFESHARMNADKKAKEEYELRIKAQQLEKLEKEKRIAAEKKLALRPVIEVYFRSGGDGPSGCYDR